MLFFAAPVAANETKSKADQVAEVIETVSEHWTVEGWGANGSARYLRDRDDETWRIRFEAMQRLVQIGKPAVKPLTAALKHDKTEVRIFAAQVLGYLSPHSLTAEAALLASLEKDTSAAVRLYAVDSLGMIGAGKRLEKRLIKIRATEKNGDVKKHIGYVLGRGASPIAPNVIRKLTEWKAPKSGAKIGSKIGAKVGARIGEQAPDFELDALNGEPVKLSSFRGKSPVVLVFLYGDT